MSPARKGPVLLLLAVWFVLALAAGASGRIAALRPPGPQLVLAGLTLTLVFLERQAEWLRSWIAGVSIRSLVGLHLTRFVGIAFLVLGRRGELPPAFATPAGWGDIVVASLAALLLLGGRAPRLAPSPPRGPSVYMTGRRRRLAVVEQSDRAL